MSDGIEEIIEDSEEELLDDEAQEATEPETTEDEYATKSLRDIAREKLKAKLDEGFDLGNKAEKARICKEIANEIQKIKGSCSYQTVSSEVPYVLKAKKKEKSEGAEGIKQVNGHQIKIKKSSKVSRPPRESTESNETETNETQLDEFQKKLLILEEFQKKGESAEELMIKFTLEDVSFLIQALGLPKPQTKRLQQRAKQIALWNEMQRAKGNPENVISISDSLLKPFMYLGIVSTFAEPIVKKYFPKADGKTKTENGIKTIHEPLN